MSAHPLDALGSPASLPRLPFRAVGGNVLLRRVYTDGELLLLTGNDSRVGQVGEVVGLGGRWTQHAPWSPPMPTQSKERNGLLDNGSLDPNWKPMWRFPDSSTPRRPMPTFTPMHDHLMASLQVGDLVVYSQARIYDVFRHESDDILVYPGCWLMGKLTEGHLVERPELRRYERQAL